MTLLGLILTLSVGGVALYLINTLIPMEANIKRIINVLVVVVLGVVTVVWLIGFFGLDLHTGALRPGPCLR